MSHEMRFADAGRPVQVNQPDPVVLTRLQAADWRPSVRADSPSATPAARWGMRSSDRNCDEIGPSSVLLPPLCRAFADRARVDGRRVAVGAQILPLLSEAGQRTRDPRDGVVDLFASRSRSDRLKRTEDAMTSGGQPIATRAGGGSVEPLAHVLPSEQEMPARSSATNSASPSTPGNAMLSVLASRCVADDPFIHDAASLDRYSL